MEDSQRIEEAMKKMSRNYKLSVVYGKQDLTLSWTSLDQKDCQIKRILVQD